LMENDDFFWFSYYNTNTTTFFFFSSRRRHTRSYGDWSSDVCSSDLQKIDSRITGRLADAATANARPTRNATLKVGPSRIATAIRSEERRVGKECRSRRSTYH